MDICSVADFQRDLTKRVRTGPGAQHDDIIAVVTVGPGPSGFPVLRSWRQGGADGAELPVDLTVEEKRGSEQNQAGPGLSGPDSPDLPPGLNGLFLDRALRGGRRRTARTSSGTEQEHYRPWFWF